MSTLRPRNTCWIKSRTESYDGHGRPVVSIKRRQARCAIVSLYRSEEDSSVRADSSASRGRADEVQADARILLKPTEQVKLGDIVEVSVTGGENVIFKISRIFRRPDVNGRIHHIDVEGMTWASG